MFELELIEAVAAEVGVLMFDSSATYSHVAITEGTRRWHCRDGPVARLRSDALLSAERSRDGPKDGVAEGRGVWWVGERCGERRAPGPIAYAMGYDYVAPAELLVCLPLNG